MQNFTKSLLCFFLFLTHFYAQSQNSLRVQDPRQGFRSGIGQIDSAAITIRPKGIYAEVGYYLTYSSKSTSFTNRKDTLEVQHYFNLPKDVQVSDSWLWFQDFIIRGRGRDRFKRFTIKYFAQRQICVFYIEILIFRLWNLLEFCIISQHNYD